MIKIYSDFGNVYGYAFWDWWRERGQYLFGEKGNQRLEEFSELDDLLSMREDIERGDVKIVAIPTNLTKTAIARRFSKLLRELEVRPSERSAAKYPLQVNKVNAESLGNCLLAYDMWKQGKSNIEIGGYFHFSRNNIAELTNDGRAIHRYEYSEKTMKLYRENQDMEREAYKRAEDTVHKRLERLKKRKNAQKEDFHIDDTELIDKEMGLLVRKKNIVKTKTKNYLNVSANRMIKKAIANIKGVERGVFPIKH